MPKKVKSGRRRKGKGKKKKGKKDKGPKPVAPPLHTLTELYNKLVDAVRTLYEARLAARKKRIEGWFMTKELVETKNDNALYRDYINDNIEDLENLIEKFKNLIKEIRDAIEKAVAERMAKLQKLLDDYEARITDLDKELQDVRNQLREFEDLMIELAQLMSRIEELLKEIEAAKFAAQQKIRHLTNQFLAERGRLHNHLEEQLFNLIKFCRNYLMPILWNLMQNLRRDNACIRWRLARTDEKNIILADKREEMMKHRKILSLEKPYWDIEWAFSKLCQLEACKKIKQKQRDSMERKMSGYGDIPVGPPRGENETIDVVSRVIPSTQLGKDFNLFLVQRLTAAKEAQERHEREKKREEKRFLKALLTTAQELDGDLIPDEDEEEEEEEEDEWEDMYEDVEWGGEDDWRAYVGEEEGEYEIDEMDFGATSPLDTPSFIVEID